MTYQDYFLNSDFEDIWAVLCGFYMEHENLKPVYSSLIETIKSLPILPEHSETTIKMCLDSENEIMVKGAPDPQEWLIGRKVEIDFSSWKDELARSIESFSDSKTFDMSSGPEKRQLARNSDTATLAAHLIYFIYWSTLYAIKTQSQHQHEFYEWLAFLENGTVKYDMEEEYVSDSFRRKQRKYWRETVANDSAIDWVWNIGILKKKLEFNIGYWRYVQRHVGWQEDVNRMQIAVNLLTIAESDYPNIDGTYLNLRTAERYSREKDSDEEDLHRVYLTKLYHDKTFHILWKWLDHNMKKWWD